MHPYQRVTKRRLNNTIIIAELHAVYQALFYQTVMLSLSCEWHRLSFCCSIPPCGTFVCVAAHTNNKRDQELSNGSAQTRFLLVPGHSGIVKNKIGLPKRHFPLQILYTFLSIINLRPGVWGGFFGHSNWFFGNNRKTFFLWKSVFA